ncbi:PQQ-binding-like beta-propeller repeat protein [Actinoplanes awajinensis]|uniref:PQQ-binding-like beta-propeller repeat protein n=1 Tax=Actinoplanes awajinensis TaxID=135946 RepID=UPI001E5E167B|nr:PQQ-binding-like beta-propeller repeat protein [Actinoplanes awajinensis]
MKRTVATLSSLVLGLPVPLWGHPGYDAEDSWFNPHESAITPATVGHLRTIWSAKLREVDESCSGFSSPVLGAGRLFATDREGVTAYDPAAGGMIWRFTWDYAEDNTLPRMAVAGDLLILANGDCQSQSDPNGQLTALDAATGRARWHIGRDAPVDTVVVDKNVVLISGNSPSDDDEVTAYRVRDGHLLWRKPGFVSSGVSANGVVPLVGATGTTAVDISTGKARWSTPEPWEVQAASPAADRFYASARSGALVAVDTSTGAIRWSAPSRASELVATDGRRVYVASEAGATALDAATGRLAWSRNRDFQFAGTASRMLRSTTSWATLSSSMWQPAGRNGKPSSTALSRSRRLPPSRAR